MPSLSIRGRGLSDRTKKRRTTLDRGEHEGEWRGKNTQKEVKGQREALKSILIRKRMKRCSGARRRTQISTTNTLPSGRDGEKIVERKETMTGERTAKCEQRDAKAAEEELINDSDEKETKRNNEGEERQLEAKLDERGK